MAAVDLRELSNALHSGRLSPVDHVDRVLDRLAADEHNAVVYLDRADAIRQAAERAAELAEGRSRGPLHGVAAAVKDLFDVAGMPTRCGSNVLRDAPPATADADVVARLRAAGAVIVAKTHTHEFAYGPTGDVAAQGPARNPHDPTRITGGSSSGSAAAVAAGHVPLALGTDTGCSVRTPAALCGVVGLKPAFGRLPVGGVFPLSESCDHVGLLGADVNAVAVAYHVLTGAPPPPAVPTLRPDLVVGRPVDDYWRPADPAIAAGVDAAAAGLAAAGVTVVDVDTPDIGPLAACYPTIVGAEAYTTHAEWLTSRPQDYQPVTAQRLLHFADQPASDYVDAQRIRRRLVATLGTYLTALDRPVDALLTPTTPIRATPIGVDTVDGIGVRPALLSLTLPWNLAGWPAVSVPVPPAGGGLPVGAQLVGVRLAESELLGLAEVVLAAGGGG